MTKIATRVCSHLAFLETGEAYSDARVTDVPCLGRERRAGDGRTMFGASPTLVRSIVIFSIYIYILELQCLLLICPNFEVCVSHNLLCKPPRPASRTEDLRFS